MISVMNPNKNMPTSLASTTALIESPKQRKSFDIKLWGWSLNLLVPWAIKINLKMPTFINKDLKKHAEKPQRRDAQPVDRLSTIRFRPYVSKVPWHTGARAFLSQLFPRYGHYCGPNWSSGKNGGSLLWDKRPIDWLDYCCYCHDMGYDSHDQRELLKADLAFLKCLETPNMSTKGDVHIANLYKTMCISGLRGILIPYREQLVKLHSASFSLGFGWLGNMRWKGWNPMENSK